MRRGSCVTRAGIEQKVAKAAKEICVAVFAPLASFCSGAILFAFATIVAFEESLA